MPQVKSLNQINLLSSLLGIAILTISVCLYFLIHQYQIFFEEAAQFELAYLQNEKNKIKTQVDQVFEYINYQYAQAEERLKSNLKNRVAEAYAISDYLYQQHQSDKSIKEIKHLIHDALYPIRWQKERGYYFIIDSQGVTHLHQDRALEGKSMWDKQDSEGRFFIQEMIQLSQQQHDNYLKYFWYKPHDDPKTMYPKYSYTRYFAPLDWIIGTGEYLDNVERDISEEIQAWLQQFHGTHHHVFLLNSQQELLFDADQHHHSIEGRLLRDIYQQSQQKTASFYPDNQDKPQRLSYLRYFPQWHWVIGCSSELDEKETYLQQKLFNLKTQLQNQIISILVIFFIIACCAFIVSYWLSHKIAAEVNRFDHFLHYSASHNQLLDPQKFKIADFIALAQSANQMVQKRQQAEADLIQINQDKNEFLAIAAHDLKNPLSVIKGYAEEIEEYATQMSVEELREIANAIQISSKRMFDLVTNLLDVNKLEEKKMIIHTSQHNLYPIIKKIVSLYCAPNNAKGLRCVWSDNCLVQHFYAHIDPELTWQIIDNLMSNAAKYSPLGGQISIDLQNHADNVQLSIQDQGQGLSTEEQQQLYKKFNRLSPQPTAGEHSTGLGLFIVKKLLDVMGGQIHCQSEPNQGCCFIVQFPNKQPSKGN